MNEVTYTSSDQRDFVEQLVHVVATSWTDIPDRPEFLRYNHLPIRLDGVIHSVLVELDGAGGLEPHRLTSKNDPSGDLLGTGYSVRYAYSPDDKDLSKFPEEVRAFAKALWLTRNRITTLETLTGDIRPVVGRFLGSICKLVDDDYILVLLFFAEDGAFESEGSDIAPGLTAAFEAEWAKARNDS